MDKKILKKESFILGTSFIFIYFLASFLIIQNESLNQNDDISKINKLESDISTSLQETNLKSQESISKEENYIKNPISSLANMEDKSTPYYKSKDKRKPSISSPSESSSSPPQDTIPSTSSAESKIHPELEEIIENNPEKTVPVIISISDFKNVEEIVNVLELNDAESIKKLDIGDLVIVNIPAKKLEEIAKESDVINIFPEQEVNAVIDSSIEQVNAPIAWNLGFTGKDVKIALLDSGINKEHPILQGKVTNEISFVTDNADDLLGHGTPIAGIIAGSEFEGHKGIAPDSSLINIKVLDDEGKGTNINVIKGINYAMEHGAKILVMAFSGAYNDPDSPINKAIKEAVDKGVIVIAASGNCGTDKSSSFCNNFTGVGVPGNSQEAITVGSVDKYNKAALFSGGSYIDGTGIKPDIVAPGVDVTAPIGLNDFISFSGTSISAPFVAGAAALLLESKPDFSPSEIKQIIEENALDLGDAGKDIRYGSGLINFERLFSDNVQLIKAVNIIPQYVFTENQKVYIVVDALGEVNGIITLPDGTERSLAFEYAEGLWKADFSETSQKGVYPIKITAKSGQISDSVNVGIEVLDSLQLEADPLPIIIDLETNETIALEIPDVQAAGIENNVCGGAISGLDPGREGINRIGAPGDVDYWKGFTGTGRILEFMVDAPSGKNYLLDVFGKCSLGLFPDEHKGSCSSGTTCQIFVPQGTYYVRIKGKSFFTDWSTTNYKVSVKVPPSCATHNSFSCSDNDVYFFDSCNNKEDKKEECDVSGFSGTSYCFDNDVYKNFVNKGCSGVSCFSNTEKRKQEECSGKTTLFTGSNYCSSDKKKVLRDDMVNEKTGCSGIPSAHCNTKLAIQTVQVKTCGLGEECQLGNCVKKPIVCFTKSDCGADSFVGDRFCSTGDIYQNFRTFDCLNPGTTSSSCVFSDDPLKKLSCSEAGCSNGQCNVVVGEPRVVDFTIEDRLLGKFFTILDDIASFALSFVGNNEIIDSKIDVFIENDNLVQDVKIKLTSVEGTSTFSMDKVGDGHYRFFAIQRKEVSKADAIDLIIEALTIIFKIPGTFVPINPLIDSPDKIEDSRQIFRIVDGVVITDINNKIIEENINQPLNTRFRHIFDPKHSLDLMLGGYIVGPASPVDIIVIDEKGRRIGSLYDDNGNFIKELHEIPEAFYSGHDNNKKWVFVPNISTNYTIEIFGVGNGTYKLITVGLRDDEFKDIDFNGNITQNERHRFKIIASNNLSQINITSLENDPPIISIASPASRDYLYTENIILEFNSTDNESGIKTIQASIDSSLVNNGQTIDLFNFSLGQHDFKVKAIDNVENIAEKTVTFTVTERNPPVSSASITVGILGNNSWYKSDVDITITATDDKSGVNRIEYNLDGSDSFILYPGAVSVAKEGNTTVFYRAIDNAGNIEETKTITVNIDKTPPESIAYVTKGILGNEGIFASDVEVNISGLDAVSGLEKIEFNFDGSNIFQPYTGTIKLTEEKITTIYYRAIDKAGNIEWNQSRVVNKLSDGSEKSNISFTKNEDKTVFISMPKGFNVSNARFKFRGIGKTKPKDFLLKEDFTAPDTNELQGHVPEIPTNKFWITQNPGLWGIKGNAAHFNTGGSGSVAWLDMVPAITLGQGKNITLDLVESFSEANFQLFLFNEQASSQHAGNFNYVLSLTEGKSIGFFSHIEFGGTGSVCDRKTITNPGEEYRILMHMYGPTDSWSISLKVYNDRNSLEPSNLVYECQADNLPIAHIGTIALLGAGLPDDIFVDYLYIYNGSPSNTGSNFPTNPSLDIGNNGMVEWSYTGLFDRSEIARGSLVIEEIQKFLNTCAPDGEGKCLIPLKLHSDTEGILEIADINVIPDDLKTLEIHIDKSQPDLTPPLTMAIAETADWVNHNINIELTAIDEFSGVGKIHYCSDLTNTCNPVEIKSCSGAKTCSINTTVSQEGESFARFYSTDVKGNIEEITFLNVKIEKAPPVTTDNAPSEWQGNDAVVALSASDATSGVALTKYCVDQTNICLPDKAGNLVEVTCPEGDICKRYVRYFSTDVAGNQEEIKSSVQIRIDKEKPLTKDNANSDWTNFDQKITLIADDVQGSGIKTTKYCVDEDKLCIPSIEGLIIDVVCADNAVCRQFIGYLSIDNVDNIEDIKHSAQIRIDKEDPITTDNHDEDWHTEDITITLNADDKQGSGIKDTFYIIYQDETPLPIASVNNNGQPVITYEDDNNKIEYWSVDLAGNEETHHVIGNIKLDKTQPETTDDYDDKWHNTPIKISLDANDPKVQGIQSGLSSIFYQIYIEEIGQGIQTYSIDNKPTIEWEDDDNWMEYWSKDVAGNEEEHFILKAIKFDETKPKLEINYPTDGTSYLNTELRDVEFTAIDPKVEGTPSGIEKIQWFLDGQEIQDPNIIKNFVCGVHNLTLKAIDIAGNSNEVSSTFTVVYDMPINITPKALKVNPGVIMAHLLWPDEIKLNSVITEATLDGAREDKIVEDGIRFRRLDVEAALAPEPIDTYFVLEGLMEYKGYKCNFRAEGDIEKIVE